MRWRVFEQPFSDYDRRSGMSLIFASEGAVRRVRNYPTNWSALSDADLMVLSWKAWLYQTVPRTVAHRELTDSSGTVWQVWDVYPSSAERRDGPERRETSRQSDDRRTRREVRVQLEEGYEHGWLAFESEQEKRRLCPIPPDWEQASDLDLIGLLAHAERAERVARGQGSLPVEDDQ
jgi:hypothetical protein